MSTCGIIISVIVVTSLVRRYLVRRSKSRQWRASYLSLVAERARVQTKMNNLRPYIDVDRIAKSDYTSCCNQYKLLDSRIRQMENLKPTWI